LALRRQFALLGLVTDADLVEQGADKTATCIIGQSIASLSTKSAVQAVDSAGAATKLGVFLAAMLGTVQGWSVSTTLTCVNQPRSHGCLVPSVDTNTHHNNAKHDENGIPPVGQFSVGVNNGR